MQFFVLAWLAVLTVFTVAMICIIGNSVDDANRRIGDVSSEVWKLQHPPDPPKPEL